MTERPRGTVTFLFSDIEGSTRLLQELGVDRYRSSLTDHRRIVREAIEAAGGTEIDTQGDSFFVAFPRAQDAVSAAVEIQRGLEAHVWPDDRKMRIRMGMHSTDAARDEGGYVGIGVHRAARMCSAGHGGQVLLSSATAELLRDADTPLALIDLGLHRLKDIAEPEHLFQLTADGLIQQFPPLRSLDDRPTNLPPDVTPLIGREREIRAIDAMLRRDGLRMLTLTGPGGSGKTRLALEVARGLLGDYPDGVYLVSLATVTEPALVLPAIADALGVSEGAGQSVPGYLARRRLLLVIDNVEQVAAAAPQLANLVAGAPGLRMLLTSREPMHLSVEHVFAVEPMAADDAVSLFVDRAVAVLSGFAITPDNRPAVEEICTRLDRLPLAIELAAARINLLSPQSMLARLSDRLMLLTGGTRDQPARHRTLRDTLAWSYDLLTEPERELFAFLSVFAGRFSLEPAERVCGAELDVVGSLIDRSLIRRDGDRLGMLSTIREFAAERLAERADADAVRDRHAAFYVTLAERAFAERHRRSAQMAGALALDHDNLREALDWLSRTDPQGFARLVGLLGWFWHAHSHFAEGRGRVKAALDALADTGGQDHARLLAAATELAAWQGDAAAAEAYGVQAIEAWRSLDREVEMGLTLYDLGWGHFFAGDNEAARARLEASLAILEPHGDDLLTNRANLGLLQVLVAIGEWPPSSASVRRRSRSRKHSATAGRSTSPTTFSVTAR